MNDEQAEFFRDKLMPIIREAANDRDENPMDCNPLRPMLKQLIGYIDYLEGLKR